MTVCKAIATQRIQPTFDHDCVTGPYLPVIDREGLRDLMGRGSRLANSPLRFTTDEECKHRMKYNVLLTFHSQDLIVNSPLQVLYISL